MKIDLVKELNDLTAFIEKYESDSEYIAAKQKRIKLLKEYEDNGIKKTDATTRQQYLETALKATAETGYFTVVERIYINQERGYLLSIGSYNELRAYQVSDVIEKKLNDLKL